MSDILCHICCQHTAPAFDELVAHILCDHSQVETKLVAKDHVYGACHYRHLGLTCGHNEQFPAGHRFDDPLGCYLYQTPLREVLKCHCGLPFALDQHVALGYKTYTVDPTTATGSLAQGLVHAFIRP